MFKSNYTLPARGFGKLMSTTDILRVFLNFCAPVDGRRMHEHQVPLRTRGFGGLEVTSWSLVPKFASSNLIEAVAFFRAKKILSTPSFGREVKPFVPCRRFTACKRSLNVTWKSGIFRQNSLAISRPGSSSFHY